MHVTMRSYMSFYLFLVCALRSSLTINVNASDGGYSISGDDYNDSIDNECDPTSDDDCDYDQTISYDNIDIIDRLQQIYDENANETVVYRVDNFNQTLDRFRNLGKLWNRLFSPYKSTAKVFELLSTSDLSEQCFSSIVSIYRAIERNELWTLKFIDSTGGIPSGFTEHVFASFGDYDQCLDIRSKPSTDRNLLITGKYCVLKLKVAYPSIESYKPGNNIDSAFQSVVNYISNYNLEHFGSVTKVIEGLNIANGTIYRHGICVPSACTAEEIQRNINKALYPITRFHVEVGPDCYTENEQQLSLNSYQTYSALILSALICVVILSTIIDVSINLTNNCYNYSKHDLLKDPQLISPTVNFLLSFSIWRNTKNLFKRNDRFPSLETIKLIVIVNAVTAHFHLFTPVLAVISLKRIFTTIPVGLLHSGKYFFVRNPVILDALFSLSGFIVSYGLFKKLDKTNGRFSYISYAIHRWLRFAVPIFGSFLFFFVIPFFGNGPVWQYGIDYFIPGCQSNINLVNSFLMVNNFVDMIDLQSGIVNTCNPPIWFLSALFQLHLIAPLLAILYHKKPKLALCVNIMMIILGTLASISPQLIAGIKPYSQHLRIETFKAVNKAFTMYHMATIQWITSFFLGILFGYGFKIGFKVGNISSVVLWLTSLFTIFVCYIWNNNLWRLEPTVSDINALGFFSIGKLLFSIAMCWIYFACCSGRGGFINKALSWSGFRALSNLSFSIFITHVLIFIYRTFTIRETHIMDDSYMVKNFVIDLILCIGLAYIYNMLIESPFNNLIKMITKPKPKKLDKPLNRNSINQVISRI